MDDTPKRWDVLYGLLHDRPHKRGAEIGIASGTTAIQLAWRLPNCEKYFCVDPARGSKGERRQNEFMDEVFVKDLSPPIKLIKHYSKVAAGIVEGPLDWVFIDAGHKYPDVSQDIRLWAPKVREGGLVTGHDYCEQHAGVMRAVDEAYDDVNVIDAQQNPVWWVEK